jgi:hypothetical protein
MSDNVIFLCSLALFLTVLLFWSIRTLPRDGWQFLCATPSHRVEDGSWQGTNYTFYGVYVAGSSALAAALFLVLNRAAGHSLLGTAATILIVFALAAPAARWIARVVEGKKHTFTIGGASFTGLLILPGAVWLVNRLLPPDAGHLSLLPLAAAMGVSYALGEGLGRLACISFGCCFGRPLQDLPPLARRFLAPFAMIYHDDTRKACYEGHLAGVPLVPIPAITACLYCLCAVAGTALFLAGWWKTAFLGCLVFSQAWRFLSELLRADFRGSMTITPYQIMALLGIVYATVISFLADPAAATVCDIRAGVALFRQSGVLLFLQGLWLALFLYMGRSTVTGSILHFHIRRERV